MYAPELWSGSCRTRSYGPELRRSENNCNKSEKLWGRNFSQMYFHVIVIDVVAFVSFILVPKYMKKSRDFRKMSGYNTQCFIL